MADDLSDGAKLGLQYENKFGVQTTAREGANFGDALRSGFLEYFQGANPTSKANEFRAQNPIKGMASSVVPALVGGATSVKARNIKQFDGFVDNFAKKGSTPISRKAREAVATFAPVELGRVGATIVSNPENTGKVVKEAIFNLGAEGFVGGISGLVGSGGRVASQEILPLGTDLRTAGQLKIRKLEEALLTPDLPDAEATKLKGQIADLITDIKAEKIGDKRLDIDLVDGDGKEISRLFKDTDSRGGNIIRSRLLQTTTDFKSSDEAKRVATAAGLDDNWDAVQLPRYVGFKAGSGTQQAKKIEHDFLKRGKLSSLDDGLLYAKEKSGMHIMGKKITGKIGTHADSDEWVVWRTDKPGKFAPDVKEYADELNARMAYLRDDNLKIDPKRPASIMDATKLQVSQTPIKEFRDGIQGPAGKLASKLGYDPKGENFLANRGKAVIEQYFTPQLYQNKKSPVATYVMGHANRAFDQSRFIAQKIINGDALDAKSKNFKKIFGDPHATGTYQGVRAIKPIIKSLDQKELNQLQDIADAVAGSDEPLGLVRKMRENGEISENLFNALNDFDKLDSIVVDDLINHQRAAGRNDLNPIKGHLMLSRVWDGDFRAPVRNEAGEIVYVAGGATPEAADQLAKDMIQEAGGEGRMTFTPAEQFDSIQDLQLAGKIATKSSDFQVLSAANQKLRSAPQTFKERKGVKGYKKAFSHKDMEDRLSAHVNQRYDYMARISVDTALEKELAHLHNTEPKQFAAVSDRLRQLEGKPGPINQGINQAVDKVMKPALGRNSATKLSSFTNEYFYHAQLGMANVAFPILNATTFIQTVFPELAFVMNAADNRITRDYYDVILAGGSDLKMKGSVGALSPMKMVAKSFQKMAGAADDDLYSSMLSRAHREGVIDPQLLNEFIGKSSEMSTTVKDVMKGDEPMINLMRTWSGWLPAKSERFARGQAFTTGYLTGQDLMGLEDEALYAFAKKFTERTMYNYGTADRATAMTGPMGRTFGLFKNWQAHYIYSMLQYADEGMKYNNWAPLMYQMGGTAAVGGVSALPLAGAVDYLSEALTDKGLMEQTYEMFGGTNPDGSRGTVSDAVFMGLPAFLGVSLSGNASAPFHDPIRDAASLASFPQWDRMRRLGATVGEAIDHWALTGEHPISSPEIRDKFIAALAPKVLARSAQITEQNALKSLNTQNVILKDMSLGERMLHATGLTPRRVGLAYEASSDLWNDQAKRKSATTKYGQMMSDAMQNKDWEKVDHLREEAMVLGLDLSSVSRSASSFIAKRNVETVQRQFSPEARKNFKDLGIPSF